MFVSLTDAKLGTPLLVNLERVLYAYRQASEDATVIVFGKMPQAAAGDGRAPLRTVAVAVTETLREIQEKRRMASV